MQTSAIREVIPSGRREQFLSARVFPIQDAERLVAVAQSVVAAATVGEPERVFEVADHFLSLVLEHIGEVAAIMWADIDESLWRTFHLALLARTRDLLRSVLLDEPVVEPADALKYIAQRYRTVVTRRFDDGPRNHSETDEVSPPPSAGLTLAHEPRRSYAARSDENALVGRNG